MSEPYYYSDAHVTLYHGDCMDYCEAWLLADVMITDPPYGTEGFANDKRGAYGRRREVGGDERSFIANDHTTVMRDTALSAWGSKPALVFGSPRMPEPPGEWADRLVWDKKRPGINGGPWRYRHESIFVTAGFVRMDNEATSILTAWPDQTDHIHAKPLGLMTSLVHRAPEGMVADPFAGSGSTLVAAANLGRKAVGVEIEERYCELVARRLDQGCFDFGEGA